MRPWKFAAGAAVLMVVVLGLSRISFNVDILRLLPSNLRQVQGLQRFLKYFSQPDELIVTVEAPDAKRAQQAADDIAAKLNALPGAVKRAVARPPWENDPGQLVELLAFLTINQPPDAVRDLLARTSPERAAETLRGTLEKLADSVSPQEVGLLSYDPYDLAGPLAAQALDSGAQQSEFASADGTFHLIYVQADKPFANYTEAGRWIEAIHQAVAPWQGKDGIVLGFTGEPAFVASISSSMQADMQSSGLVTLLIIALIFYGCYRRGWPLLELQGMLLLTFVVTLTIAGLCFSQLTVIGVGCAAILIGLCVDYGYFIYQRSQRHTGNLRELQRQCLSYIVWTAGTTAAAFFALNVSSLPGLSQLGNLVGVGVIVGAGVMLTVFAPLTLRRHQRETNGGRGALFATSKGAEPDKSSGDASGEKNSPRVIDDAFASHPESRVERLLASEAFNGVGAAATLALVAVLLGTLLLRGLPGTDFSPTPLRPRHSEAYAAIDRISQKLLGGEAEPLSLVVEGPTVEGVRQGLVSAETQLASLQKAGRIRSFRTPLLLWPNAAHQGENLPALRRLADELPRLRQAVLDAGFQPEAFALTETVFQQIVAWSTQTLPIWPGNEASRWILRRLANHADGQWRALGFVQPNPQHAQNLDGAVQGQGIYLTGWPLLTTELRQVIPREFAWAAGGIAVIVLGLLALAFRNWKALALFVGATALVGWCLLGAMSLFGLQWNVFNLAALLLLMGTGTDYSILLLLALRRNGGNVPAARREISLVVCLCALSASAGFGTISWANHAGLASLGQTCALGLLIDAAVSVFLLPPAWRWLHRN